MRLLGGGKPRGKVWAGDRFSGLYLSREEARRLVKLGVIRQVPGRRDHYELRGNYDPLDLLRLTRKG